jgi:hypothetical protein
MAAIREAVMTLKRPGLPGTMKVEQIEKIREKLPAYFGKEFAIL